MKSLLLAVAVLVATAGIAHAQTPLTATCAGATVPAWTSHMRPSNPPDGMTGYNLTAGYCERYVVENGGWVPSSTFNVLIAGADPSGRTDSAPAFRAAIATGRDVYVPPGTYLFATSVTPPCCAFDNAAVLVQGQTNFRIYGAPGAIIEAGPGIALSSLFHFDKDSNFNISGLTLVGNRTGLTSGQENVGMTFSSDVNFTVQDTVIAGNFGGNGAGIAGDWLVNGVFRNLVMQAVGHCFDIAYLQSVRIEGVQATGAGTDGGSGAGDTGQTCFSTIVDAPNANNNNTGVSFTETNHVRVSGVDEHNFSTGGLIDTGLYWTFAGNEWHDNPGVSPGTPGIGLYIHYDSNSVGVPPSNITISDRFSNNGATVAGYGLYLSAGAITNSDELANINIIGSAFDNNASVGAGADGTAHFANLQAFGNEFSGSAQTLSFSANFEGAASFYQDGTGAVLFPNRITFLNNQAIYSRDASGSAQLMMFGDASNETVIRALNNSANIRLQNQSGANVLTVWGLGTIQPEAFTVSTLPSCNAPQKGMVSLVTDASSPTYGGTLTGGGSTVTMVVCTGAAWVAN